jgi:hypothetical protein
MMQVYNSNHPQHGLFMPAPPSSTNTSPLCCSRDDNEDFHIRSKLFLAAMTTSLQRIAHEELLLSQQAQGRHSVVNVSTETTAAATSTTTTALSLISDQVHPKLLEVSRLRRRNQRSLLLQVQEQQQQQQQQLEQPHSVTQTRRIFSRSDSTTPSTIVENSDDDDDSSLSSYGSSD